MPSTLILGYGGFGTGCVKDYSRANSWPGIVLDSHVPDMGEDDLYLDYVELSSVESLDEGRIRNMLSGYRNVLLVSSLGGESFDYAYNVISHCARQLEITIISICTLPYSFESDRRTRAMENLKTLSQTAHNLFVIDSQKTIQEDCPVEDYLTKTKLFLIRLIKIIVNLLEYGPFKSYCDAPAYTLAMGSSPLYADAVRDALKAPLYDLGTINGKILVCTDSELGSSETGEILAMLTQYGGMLPEYIGTAEMDPQSVILFIPISFRLHE